MKIIVLDGKTLNPGDISWAPFEALGEVTVFDGTAPEQVVERCAGYDIVINNKVPLTKEIICQMPWVQYIGLLSTGYNVVDVKAAKEKNLPVTFVPAYSTEAVAQHTFALLLNMTNHVGLHSNMVKQGVWENCSAFCFWSKPLTELAGKNFGILGMGSIGKTVAGIATAMGMKVIYHSRSQKDLPYGWVSLEELFKQSDVLSLHCPYSEQTHEIINKGNLDLMKPGAYLLNTARGGLINEQAVADALQAGRLAGFGADVLASEPPKAGNPIIACENTALTPHIAWAAKETRERLMQWAADNLQAFLEGHPQNVAWMQEN